MREENPNVKIRQQKAYDKNWNENQKVMPVTEFQC